MKFELNEWKKELTDEEILSDIQETAKALGKEYISISTYKSHGKYSQRQFNLISVLGKRLYWKQDFEVKERQPN